MLIGPPIARDATVITIGKPKPDAEKIPSVMYNRPCEAVAVYVLAPPTSEPIATEIALNSDSTFRNSQSFSVHVFTNLHKFSTMWVCGEIGYAQTTPGRHNATASATPSEPSICLSIVAS